MKRKMMLGLVLAAMLVSLGGCYYVDRDYAGDEDIYWNGVHDHYTPYYWYGGYYRDRDDIYFRNHHLHDRYWQRQHFREWDHHRDGDDRSRQHWGDGHFRGRDRDDGR